jgi:O-antigen ligase/Flp pilus assembly protein TadD
MDPLVALFGTWRRYLGLSQLADNVVLFVAAALVFRSNIERGRLVLAGLASMIPVIAYAFAQRFGIDFVTYKEGLTLPIATLGQPDILGALGSIGAITAVAVAVRLWSGLGWLERAGLIVAALGCLFVEFFTGVRAGALGILFGGAALLVIQLLTTVPSQRRRTLLLTGGGAAVIAIALLLSPVGRRLSPDVLRSDLAVAERLQTWDAASRLVEARPVFGLGPDNFANGYPAYRSIETQILIPGQLENSTHSWILYYATSAGVVGLGAMIAFVVLVVLAGVRLAERRDAAALALVPVAAYLGQGSVGINDLSLDWVLWLAAGVIAGAAARPIALGRSARLRPATNTAVAAVAVAVILVAGVGLVLAAQRIGGSRELGLAQALLGRNGPEAVLHARAALQQDPRRPELWANYGGALANNGSDAAAVPAFIEATRLDPTYPNHWRNLALVLGRLGNTTGAYAAVKRANAADPWDPDSLVLLSQLALARGDPQLAAAKGALAVRVDPANLDGYDAPVLADLSLQRFNEAERLLEQAFTHGENVRLRFRRAQLYAATQRQQLALADLDVVLKAEPTNPDAIKLKQQLQGQ